MMNGYLEYLAKTVPVISTRQTVINISQMGNIMGDMIYLENGYKTGWQQSCTEDYMGILNRYADDRKNNIPSVAFIAYDSIELAKKCSAILSMYRQTRGAHTVMSTTMTIVYMSMMKRAVKKRTMITELQIAWR